MNIYKVSRLLLNFESKSLTGAIGKLDFLDIFAFYRESLADCDSA